MNQENDHTGIRSLSICIHWNWEGISKDSVLDIMRNLIMETTALVDKHYESHGWIIIVYHLGFRVTYYVTYVPHHVREVTARMRRTDGNCNIPCINASQQCTGKLKRLLWRVHK